MDTQIDQLTAVTTGHSSDVRMSLRIGSVTVAVLQASRTELKLSDAAAIAQGNAMLEISVDGRSRSWPIRVLPTSLRPDWVSIADR